MSNATLACLLAQQQAGAASWRGMPSNQGGRNAAQPPGARDSLPCQDRGGKGLPAATIGGLGQVKALPWQQGGRSGAQASPTAPGSVTSLVKGLQALQRPIHRPPPPGALRSQQDGQLLALSSRSILCQRHSQPSLGQTWDLGWQQPGMQPICPKTREDQLQGRRHGGSSCRAVF